jgi:hypothetical protein
MISRAEELGFTEIGISNHLICHPNIGMLTGSKTCILRTIKSREEIFKRTVDELRTASLKHKKKSGLVLR